jgi:hypothetical protein
VLQAAEPWSQFNADRRDQDAVAQATDISRSQN